MRGFNPGIPFGQLPVVADLYRPGRFLLRWILPIRCRGFDHGNRVDRYRPRNRGAAIRLRGKVCQGVAIQGPFQT